MVESLVGRMAISGFSLVFVIAGLYNMNKGRIERAQSKRIAETETTPVRELQPGIAEIKGVARPAEDATPFESPITKQKAVAAAVEMEEWESSGQGGGSWETQHEEQTAVSMRVDDGTGEVEVDLPADGELNVEKNEWKVGSGDEPPEQITQYLDSEAEIGDPSRYEVGPLSIGERRRYSEGMIEPDEEVYVLGALREEQSGWGERNYVIDAPTEDGDFILSDKSEAELIREGKRGGLVNFGFGGVLVAAGLLGMVIPWVAA